MDVMDSVDSSLHLFSNIPPVLAPKEYFKLYPEGFGDEDVYVCESRYSAKSKSFKKIKMWTMPLSSVRFLPRDVPLPVVRVASMFAVKPEEKAAEVLDEEVNVDKVNVSLSPAVFRVQGESDLHSLLCACRRGRTFLWTWPTENRAASTTSSSSTTTPGSKWETSFTSPRMDWCATEWAGGATGVTPLDRNVHSMGMFSVFQQDAWFNPVNPYCNRAQDRTVPI